MTTLPDKLRQLADGAPGGSDPRDRPTPAAAPEDLWARGKRLQRRRRLGAVALAGALTLALGAVAGLVVDGATYDVAPADTESQLALPSDLFVPSPWTPGTDETGPIGPLSAVLGAYRRTTWGEPTFGVAGVSPSGGYAYLELPGLVAPGGEAVPSQGPLVLSPDGRWIAYYLTGSTSADPYLGGGDPVVGVALHDTETGETRREMVPTDHGLSFRNELTWVGDSVLVGFSQIDSWSEDAGGNSVDSSGSDLLTWNAATDVREVRTGEGFPSFDYLTAPAGDELAMARPDVRYVVLAADGATERLGRLDVPVDSPPLLNPGRTLVATTEDRDGPGVAGARVSPVVFARVDGPDAGVTRRLDRPKVPVWSHGVMTATWSSVRSTRIPRRPVTSHSTSRPGGARRCSGSRSVASRSRPRSPTPPGEGPWSRWASPTSPVTPGASTGSAARSWCSSAWRWPGGVVPASDAEHVSFEDYVLARRRALLRTAYLLTGQHADAEDLVQTALIKAVPHWERISDHPETDDDEGPDPREHPRVARLRH